MKNRIVIAGLLLVALLLLWLLHKPQKHAAIQPPAKEVDQATASTAIQQVQTNTVIALPVAPESTPESNPATFIEKRLKQMEEDKQKGLNEWRTPIEFYGRVVDESNNVVPGAQVDFDCNDISPTGTSYYHTQSNENGSFSLKGVAGKLLGVYVNKEGYYPYDPHGQNFYYAGQNQNFVPDAGNPVVFRLRKKGKGESLIITDYPSFAHIAQLKHDGTPVELNLLNGTQVTAGSGQLNLQFWRDLSDKTAKVFNWKLQITVPGGGLVETNEQFAFTAPETGYQSTVIVDESTNDPEWKGALKDKYYLRLPDGNYGRIDFEFMPYNGVFTVHSVINPSGSENLEPIQP